MDRYDSLLPAEPADRLSSVLDLLEAQHRRVALVAASMEALVGSPVTQVDDAVARLLAAQELGDQIIELSELDEVLAASLVGVSVAELNELLGRAFEDPDAAPACLAVLTEVAERLPTRQRVVEALEAVAEYAEALLPQLASVEEHCRRAEAELALRAEPALEGERVVVIGLDQCGAVELGLVVAGEASFHWASRRGALVLPGPLAQWLSTCRTAIDVGPAVEVRFDPIPLALRVADCLAHEADPVAAYEMALVRGAICPAAQSAAARHLDQYGSLEP